MRNVFLNVLNIFLLQKFNTKINVEVFKQTQEKGP